MSFPQQDYQLNPAYFTKSGLLLGNPVSWRNSQIIQSDRSQSIFIVPFREIGLQPGKYTKSDSALAAKS